MIEEKPTKEYLIALLGEAMDMTSQYLRGETPKDEEGKQKWMRRKDYLQDEIKRVRRMM